MAVLVPYKGTFFLWKFLPSVVASVIFCILFLIIAILQFWRIIKLRSWFGLWFAFGCLSETVGYAGRIVAYDKTGELGPYIIQAVFIVIAPVLFSASIFMTLSRIIRCVKAQHLSPIPIKWLSWVFLLGDQAALNIQSGGAGLTSSDNPKSAKLGEDIIIAGLFIQIVLLAIFFITAIIFQRRLWKQPTSISLTSTAPWKATLYMMYIASTLIFARSIFRVVEFIQGANGYSLTHEWTLYVFDAVPMLGVSVAFWYWYPGSIQPAPEDGETVELHNRKNRLGRFLGRG